MAKMIVQHIVKDFSQWKTVYDSMHGLRKQLGCTAEVVYKGHDNPQAVAVVTHWGTLDQARKYGQSQELKDAMKNAGVMGAPNIDFVA
jgi:heme-degrading monooxygenase HmoA